MQGKLVKRCAATVEEVPLMLAIDKNFRGALAEFKLVLDSAGKQIQRGGNIPNQFQIGNILALLIGGQHVNVHQVASPLFHMDGSYSTGL